jgi:restriction system protein
MNANNMWMVRAGEGGFIIDEFLKKQFVGIGWNDIGDLSNFQDYDSLKKAVRTTYPDYKDGKVNIVAGQLFRFSKEFKKTDKIVTYNPASREYWIGDILSDYSYSQHGEYFHKRTVKWNKSVSRDVLSVATKNSLGAISTIFLIPVTAASELLDPLQSSVTAEQHDSELLETIKEDIEEKALEFIKDNILKLDWDEMQELTAGLLRGIGYKTFVSPKGSDRGKDIIASKDGLGLESRTIVEVKHRKQAMGAPEVRSFLGALRQGDKGVYVSTGGFSKEARYEAERASIPVTLIDADMLVSLIVQNYENFDTDTRALIPLRKIYWPIQYE